MTDLVIAEEQPVEEAVAEPGEETTEAPGDDVTADMLVEEVSIDGMCGVY